MSSHPPHGHLHLYVDDQIVGEERKAVRQHLGFCTVCSAHVDSLRRLRAGVAAAADIELPSAFEQRIRRAVNHEGTDDASWGGVELVARRAVAVIAVVVLIAALLSGFHASAQELPSETMIVVGQADSVPARVFVKQGEISRDDMVYAVVSR